MDTKAASQPAPATSTIAPAREDPMRDQARQLARIVFELWLEQRRKESKAA
jgi:hypothetical protein